MKKILFSIILIGTFLQSGFSQSFDKDKLDSYFSALEDNNKFMGGVSILKNGTPIYTKNIGFSDIELGIKANKDSKYRIGSISKTFTAVLALKAVENGILNLNQTIDKYFPSLENADIITVQHLLKHRSGIHNFTDNENYMSWKDNPKTEKEMVNIIKASGIDFQADSKAQYSNSNYVLLTFILEKTFDKSYADLLNEYIIKPSELKDTYFGKEENECKSYSYIGEWIVESETDPTVPLGAGGIVSTASDLTKFSNNLFNGDLLNNESLKIMKTITDGYGCGLFQFPYNDKIGYGHTGGIDGFTSIFAYFPDGNISYALTSNGTNYNNNDISIAVLSAVYGFPYNIPEFSNYKISSEELNKYLGFYSSKNIPLAITITKEENTLIAQATGQSAFPLEASEKDIFKFDQAGIILEFNPTENTVILNQGGGQFKFSKE